MIGYIEGTVLAVHDQELLIKAGSVGYEVSVGTASIGRLQINIGDTAALFTDMIVREDSIRLFGFESQQAKQLFQVLLSVNGIGAKLALTVIDRLGTPTLLSAVQTGNHSILERVPGVGIKSAKKIVLELENKIKPFLADGTMLSRPHAGSSPVSNEIEDLISALVNLGYNVNQAEKAVRNLWTEGSSFETVFKAASKQLSDL